MRRAQLQLLGCACMLLASKYEEIYAPAVDEFVYISDNTYTREQVRYIVHSTCSAEGSAYIRRLLALLSPPGVANGDQSA
jgi:hypothetical protein